MKLRKPKHTFQHVVLIGLIAATLPVYAAENTAVVIAVSRTETVITTVDTENLIDGEIRKIKPADGDTNPAKLTIKHGDIKQFDMPAMTMVFTVKDARLLEGLKAGDNVQFTIEKSDGALLITNIKKTLKQRQFITGARGLCSPLVR
jgi:Cu(I)/Ag(I) efflux system periplasmic protein CusF